MHNAPSVRYPVGRPVFAGVLAGSVWAAGAAVTLFWFVKADSTGWRHLAAAIAVLACGGWALLAWLRSPEGSLHWDGGGWAAPGMAGTGRLEVALDLQQRVLVRWRGDGGSRWIWLERRRSPASWADARRAVYSRARPHALPPARPPAARS